jgi:putative ABC transport system permease protein
MLQDLTFAVRMLRRAPGFAAISVLTLGLGIGAAALVFSWVSAVLTASAPVADMDRLAGIWSHNRTQGEAKNVVSTQDFVEWRRRQHSFDRFGATRSGALNLGGISEPVRVRAAFSTADFFAVLGIKPLLGRTFTADEERPGMPLVAVLGYRFWRDRFGGQADVPGREILLDGRRATIVGVMPPEAFAPDVSVPLTIEPRAADYSERRLFVFARLRPGVTLEQAAAEMAQIGRQLERELPETHRGWGVNVRPLQEEFLGPQARLFFALITGASAAILLIGCANIANLLLARGISRAREVAVRTALGASRARLVRQMLVESLVLALAGAAAGLVVAHWGLGLLRAEFAGLGADAAVMERAIVDGRVLAFAALASVVSTLVFGLLPALQSVRPDVNQSLRDGSRATGGTRTRRLRNTLVASEVALAVLFLVVALLAMRTLAAVMRIEPGFDSENVLTLRVSLPEARYATDASVAEFFDRVLERLRSTPAVTAAGAGLRVPAAGSRWNPSRSLSIEGRPSHANETVFAADLTVTPGYLEALRIPLRAGRLLTSRDSANAPLAVVINEMTVRRYWDGDTARALGARVRLGDERDAGTWRTVVGVVGSVRNDDIDAPPLPMIYVPLAQRPSREMTLVLRTTGDPLAQVDHARAAVASVDPEQPVYEIKSMAQVLEEDMRMNILVIGIMGLFATVALALAALGIYGVVSHAVAQRTHEIGVRIALGAAVRDVIRLVARQGLTPVVAGLAAGLAAGLGVSRFMTSILYEVTPTDPLTYVGVVVILGAVALLACIVPARRAARVDPLLALRAE